LSVIFIEQLINYWLILWSDKSRFALSGSKFLSLVY